MIGSVHRGIAKVCLTLLGWAAAQGVLLAADKPLTTYDGRHSISTIALTVVYFVPKDRTPLPD